LPSAATSEHFPEKIYFSPEKRSEVATKGIPKE
jgi:hypothetical protein